MRTEHERRDPVEVRRHVCAASWGTHDVRCLVAHLAAVDPGGPWWLIGPILETVADQIGERELVLRRQLTEHLQEVAPCSAS